MEMGITARCTSILCTLTPPAGTFLMWPFNKFKCNKLQWKMGQTVVEKDAKIRLETFQEYNDLDNDRIICMNQRTKKDKSIWDYVSSVITPEFGPAGTIGNR